MLFVGTGRGDIWSSRQWQNASGLGQVDFSPGPLVSEGSALSVQRTSGDPKSERNGSRKQAAVELIGRCLSSRAIRCVDGVAIRDRGRNWRRAFACVNEVG